MYKEIYDDYIALNSLHTNKVIDEAQRQLCLEELRSRIKSAQHGVRADLPYRCPHCNGLLIPSEIQASR